MCKYIFALLFLFYALDNHAQTDLSQIHQTDIDLKRYEKDTTANAIVIYEKGDFKFHLIDQNIFLIKEYVVKLKIFNSKGFDNANIEIPLYKTSDKKEEAYDIKGITHNGVVKTGLLQKDIYEVDKGENWYEKKFTLPNIKEGSVIIYSYKVKTPFFFNLDGWNFQSDIPKIYSEFNAEIPGIYFYNRSLYGGLPLTIKENQIKSRCFDVGAANPIVDCEVIKYAMKHIPAFNSAEEYMLASSNYISRLDFELATHYRYDGTKKEYTKTWKSVDSEFKKDKDIGRQLVKNSFFTKQFEENNLRDGNDLKTAQNIFDFVKRHFTWNGKYGIYKNIRVKEAFNDKVGNIGEINISLINLLNAADIKTNLMLISTRKHGLPKKTQPAITDFNYVIARAEIEGKVYLLDASEKLTPFGMLPFRCLNHYGRVMDFKKDSYWQDILPEIKNKVVIRGNASLDIDNGEIKGKIREINQGYKAIAKYSFLQSKTEVDYLDEIENSSITDFYINDYNLEDEKSNDRILMQSYDFVIENTLKNDNIYLNPILIKYFTTNPFISSSRNFPIDFGYPFSYEYSISMNLPENYQIASIPENKAMSLPNGGGILDFSCEVQSQQLKIRFLFQIKNTHFQPESYRFLKAFYSEAIDISKNTIVSLKKM